MPSRLAKWSPEVVQTDTSKLAILHGKNGVAGLSSRACAKRRRTSIKKAGFASEKGIGLTLWRLWRAPGWLLGSSWALGVDPRVFPGCLAGTSAPPGEPFVDSSGVPLGTQGVTCKLLTQPRATLGNLWGFIPGNLQRSDQNIARCVTDGARVKAGRNKKSWLSISLGTNGMRGPHR